jgi:hypothetical protein
VCERVRVAQSAPDCFCRTIRDASRIDAVGEGYNYENHIIKSGADDYRPHQKIVCDLIFYD